MSDYKGSAPLTSKTMSDGGTSRRSSTQRGGSVSQGSEDREKDYQQDFDEMCGRFGQQIVQFAYEKGRVDEFKELHGRRRSSRRRPHRSSRCETIYEHGSDQKSSDGHNRPLLEGSRDNPRAHQDKRWRREERSRERKMSSADSDRSDRREKASVPDPQDSRVFSRAPSDVSRSSRKSAPVDLSGLGLPPASFGDAFERSSQQRGGETSYPDQFPVSPDDIARGTARPAKKELSNRKPESDRPRAGSTTGSFTGSLYRQIPEGSRALPSRSKNPAQTDQVEPSKQSRSAKLFRGAEDYATNHTSRYDRQYAPPSELDDPLFQPPSMRPEMTASVKPRDPSGRKLEPGSSNPRADRKKNRKSDPWSE